MRNHRFYPREAREEAAEWALAQPAPPATPWLYAIQPPTSAGRSGLAVSQPRGATFPMAEARRIALFGGTFDPVHLGHVHLAASAKSALALDEIRFIPCRISPHKGGIVPTPAADRLEMLRLATRDLPWAVVDDFETRRAGPSYSWRTAEAMRQRFPDTRLFWIMGTDQWDVLLDWARPERLAACVEFIVFTRGQPPLPREGYVLHAIDGDHPASASAIRQAIAAGETAHPWLNPDVSRWITDRGLYQKQ